MSEYERQQKQRYLRENILEKEYDPQEFMDFCENKKGSVDIDSWTIYQLKNIVRSFVEEKQGTKDEFSSFQMSPEPISPKKQSSNDWADFQMHIPQVEEKKDPGLSSVDLDFLQMMGMSVPAKKQQQKPVQPKPVQSKPVQPIIKPQPIVSTQKPQISNVPTNVQKVKPKNPNEQFVKQMQNQNFIAVFNNPINNKPSSPSPFPQIQKQLNQKPAINQVPSATISPQKKLSSTEEPSTNESNNKPLPFQPVIKPERDIPQSGPEEDFVTQIKCKQISKNKLPQGIICRIVNHEIVNPNVFVPNFVMYTINTSPLNIEVKRRMKDFEELRMLLKKMFPTTQIPFLERYSRLSETQPHIISKQKIHLQQFLNSLLMNPALKCRILEDFLLCTDLELMKKIFRELQKTQRPKGIEDLWTTTGTVKLNTNAASRKYMNQQQLYIDFVENSFNKLKALYDQLTIYYQNTSKIIDDIATVFDQLKETTKIVNENFEQSLRFKNFEPMLGQVTYIHRQLSEAMQRQSKNIQTQLKHMFKYEISNISTVKENMKTLSNIYEAYQKRSDKDTAKKQSYESKKLNQYKVGAELPSKNITVLKHQAAYAQNQFKEELCRYMNELSQKIGEQFEIFSTLQVSIAGDMDLVWRQFQKFVEKR